MAETNEERHLPTPTQLLERHVRELSTLHDIARAMTSVLDLESVLNRIVEAAVYLTNAEEGFLLLVDDETGDLTLRAGKGLGEKAARGMSIKVTDSIAGQVVKTGRPIRMGGFRRDEEYKVKTGYLVKSLVNVPIKTPDRVIGILAVDHSISSKGSFTNHDVALLSSLADYAAIAIQNAHLFAEASARADELAKALQEQTSVTPSPPSLEEDRRDLEQIAQGLRVQQDEVLRGIESTRQLARDLHAHAQNAEEVASGLGLWDERARSLLSRLERLVQAGLPHAGQASTLHPETRPPADAGTLAIASVSDNLLLQHLVEGALICDANGLIRRANQAAAQILDKPMTELINANLQNIIDTPRWGQMVGSLRLALAMRQPGQAPMPPVPEARLFINERTIRAKLIPIHESQTGVANIFAILHDISAETEGWRARDEALVTLSQKLRGPMTTVATYNDLLLGETLGAIDSPQRRYLEHIQGGVERLKVTLNELGQELASSRQRINLETSPPTSEFISQVADAAQKVLALDGVSIIRDIDTDLPPVQIGAECASRILGDLLAAAGGRASVGGSVRISTQLQAEDGESGHLFILIRGGDITQEDVPDLKEDAHIAAAVSLAESEGSRIWVERSTDGSDLICLLLPLAELPLSGDQP